MAGNPTIAAPGPFAVKPARVNIFAKPSAASSATQAGPRPAGVFDEAAACEAREHTARRSGTAAWHGHASQRLLRPLAFALLVVAAVAVMFTALARHAGR